MASNENLAAIAMPEPPIPASCNQLANLISDVDQALSQLIDQIQPALGPHRTATNEEPQNPSPEKSSVAQFIDNECVRLSDMLDTIRSIHARIEL